MKFIQQFSIILFVSFLGEGLKLLLPFPIPASVYGLVLMLAALQFHVIKLDQVRETSAFLIEIMPVMFIPAGVGLLNSWNVLKPICIPVILITLLTTIIVMTVTGQVAQIIIQKGKKEEKR
ncbi:MAG: CidA/LrgA family protein [Clostridiales bacterium]|nr:CidA/LrgA family protein [Clostridiales bacterium]